jgi:hypothetical protein
MILQVLRCPKTGSEDLLMRMVQQISTVLKERTIDRQQGQIKPQTPNTSNLPPFYESSRR